jgi:hypothetical protein
MSMTLAFTLLLRSGEVDFALVANEDAVWLAAAEDLALARTLAADKLPACDGMVEVSVCTDLEVSVGMAVVCVDKLVTLANGRGAVVHVRPAM